MPQPKLRKNRRNVPLGIRIIVCGHPVNHENHLICLLPGNVNHTTHVSMAVAEGNTLVLAFRKPGQRETEWQPVVDAPRAP